MSEVKNIKRDVDGCDGMVIACPECKQPYADASKVRARPGTSGCSDLVQITYHCPAGHRFRLIVHNHKGSIVLLVESDGMILRPESTSY